MSRPIRSACDYCRVKKAKCDDVRPCRNCQRKGIPCEFNPAEHQPTSKMDKAFMHLETKFDLLDAKITKLLSINTINQPTSPSIPNPPQFRSRKPLSTDSLSAPTAFSDDDLLASVVDDLLPLINSSSTTGSTSSGSPLLSAQFLEEVFDTHTRDPYFITLFDHLDPFPSPTDTTSSSTVMDIASLVSNTSDMSSVSTHVVLTPIQDRVLREDAHNLKGRMDLTRITREILLPDIAGTPRAEFLIEAYLDHIYPFFPIVCEATVAGIKTSWPTSHVAQTQYLLLLALGEVCLASEGHCYWSAEGYLTDDLIVAPPPGFDYFWAAAPLVSQLQITEKPGFEVMMVQLLICVYYMKTNQLSALKKCVLEGSDTLFSFIQLEGHKHTHRDILLRLYWVFLHLERALHNLGLLEHPSSLVGIQTKVAIPRGCKSNFPRDADTFYSNCYMQHILLANIDDKATAMSSEMLLNDDKYGSGIDVNEALRVFIKFEHELNTWRTLLPFNFQWEEDIAVRRSPHVEMDLLKMKYYLGYVTVCQFFLEVCQTWLDATNETTVVVTAYKCQAASLVEKCISFTSKASTLYSQQQIVNLDPTVTAQLMRKLYFVGVCPMIHIQLLKDQIKSAFVSCERKMHCFALHSPTMNDKLQTLRELYK